MQFVPVPYEQVEYDAINVGPQHLVHEQLLSDELTYWQRNLPVSGSPRTNAEAFAIQFANTLPVFPDFSQALGELSRITGGQDPDSIHSRQRIAAMYAMSILMHNLVQENIPAVEADDPPRGRLILDLNETIKPIAFSAIVGVGFINGLRMTDPPLQYHQQDDWFQDKRNGLYLRIRMPVNASSTAVQTLQRRFGGSRKSVTESFNKDKTLQLYPFASFGALAIKGY